MHFYFNVTHVYLSDCQFSQSGAQHCFFVIALYSCASRLPYILPI